MKDQRLTDDPNFKPEYIIYESSDVGLQGKLEIVGLCDAESLSFDDAVIRGEELAGRRLMYVGDKRKMEDLNLLNDVYQFYLLATNDDYLFGLCEEVHRVFLAMRGRLDEDLEMKLEGLDFLEYKTRVSLDYSMLGHLIKMDSRTVLVVDGENMVRHLSSQLDGPVDGVLIRTVHGQTEGVETGRAVHNYSLLLSDLRKSHHILEKLRKIGKLCSHSINLPFDLISFLKSKVV